jgi:hypothetical protein
MSGRNTRSVQREICLSLGIRCRCGEGRIQPEHDSLRRPSVAQVLRHRIQCRGAEAARAASNRKTTRSAKRSAAKFGGVSGTTFATTCSPVHDIALSCRSREPPHGTAVLLPCRYATSGAGLTFISCASRGHRGLDHMARPPILPTLSRNDTQMSRWSIAFSSQSAHTSRSLRAR